MRARNLTPAVAVLVLAGLLTVGVPAAVLAFSGVEYGHPALTSGGSGGVNLAAAAVVVVLPVVAYLLGTYLVDRERTPESNR
jgi:hypothetical protein